MNRLLNEKKRPSVLVEGYVYIYEEKKKIISFSLSIIFEYI